ncbi:MAG TPA: hypothetical protein VMT68_15505 [Caulobacteraceae bacterium]|nr:hypothetical protein [Caulobacteraceae bacterium]
MDPEDALAADLDRIAAWLRQRAQLFDPDWMRRSLEGSGRRVTCEPESPDVVTLIEGALRDTAPYSVIRLGDGEANLMTFARTDCPTPALARWAAEALVRAQADAFEPTAAPLAEVGRAIAASAQTADIVGVLGLWVPTPPRPEDLLQYLGMDPRGMSGQLWGREIALELDRELPPSVAFASAHLYVAVLAGLERLVGAARRVVCVTGRDAAVIALRTRFSGAQVSQVAVGTSRDEAAPLPATPSFLDRTRARLDAGPGVLHLVGAGPWSEIYCDWIKREGGVAVDIGSGFDLLAGLETRPIHPYLAARSAGGA